MRVLAAACALLATIISFMLFGACVFADMPVRAVMALATCGVSLWIFARAVALAAAPRRAS